MAKGRVKDVRYEVRVRKAEADPDGTNYAKRVEKLGVMRKCVKCHARRKMISEVCLECINDLRRHHEQFEEIWDIATPDLEKLNAPGVLEDFVLLMMQGRGDRAVETWLGVEIDSIRYFWRKFKERVALGVAEDVAIKERCQARLSRGENSRHAHFIPFEAVPRRPTTDPDALRRTLRRRAEKAAALAATQAVKEAS